MKFLHIKQPAFFLVNVRNVNHDALEICCGQGILIKECRQALRGTDAKINPTMMLVVHLEKAATNLLVLLQERGLFGDLHMLCK